jgi:membrane protease YdiL (CAAX protease family)
MLLATRKHTLIFLLICVAITASSAFNAGHSHAPRTHRFAPRRCCGSTCSLIALEWLWVRFVMRGMRQQGRSIREFFGQRWAVPAEVAKDLLYAALVFAVIYGIAFADSRFWPHGASPNNPLLPAIPSGALGISVWVALSISAGICEEIVFRGYMQRQLTALTGKPGVGDCRAGRSYSDLRMATRVCVRCCSSWSTGCCSAALAAWRGNIRAGIWEHAVWDILARAGFL